MQRNIGAGTVVDVAYVGTKSRKLARRTNLNTPAYGAAFKAAAQDPTKFANGVIPAAEAAPGVSTFHQLNVLECLTCHGRNKVGLSIYVLTDRRKYVILFLSHAQEPSMNDDATKDLILHVFEASLEAQLRAVRRLRQGEQEPEQARRRKGLSQVDMAFDILKKANGPLHVSELLARIKAQFGMAVDRESLVSSLTKKVARGDRFLRPEKNTFVLRPESR